MSKIFHFGENTAELHCGEAIRLMEDGKVGRDFELVIADPPYSSGAGSLSGKQQGTGKKYTTNSILPDFTGDSQDQRAWTRWMAAWLGAANELCVDGAVVLIFTDWRQLPSTTDALQWANWYWRGIIPWDKLNGRPQLGRFRQQAEFIVWGSKGAMPLQRGVGVLPGAYGCAPPTPKHRKHQTEKPVELLRQLMRICPKGGRILDPFMGSGTAEEAALLEGYDIAGIELTKHYYQVSCDRCEKLSMTEGNH